VAAAFGAAVLGACGATDAAPAKKPPHAAMTLTFPTVTIGGGVEDTQCVVLRLGNAAPVHVGAIHNVLGEGSHHLIVYRVNDTEEQPVPFPCAPFTDTLDPERGSPLMVTQKADDLLTLPPGVGYTLDADQMVRLEMHFINPRATPRTITASTTVLPISDDDFEQEADFLFIGNPDIRIAPRSTATLGPTFFAIPEDLAGVNFFAMTGHERNERAGRLGGEPRRRRDDGLRRPRLALERAEDRGVHAAADAPGGRRVQVHVHVEQHLRRDGPLRRIGERGDVLLLGVLLPEPRRAGLRPLEADRRRGGRQPLLPRQRAV
jgi:hypothetical protein